MPYDLASLSHRARAFLALGAVLLAGCGVGGGANDGSAARFVPTADAGTDHVGRVGSLVTLDGRASADPEGRALTFSWTQVDGPSVFLSSTTAARPSFTPTLPGTYVFELSTSAGAGVAGSPADEVTVIVIDDLAAQPRRAPAAVARAGGLAHASFLASAPNLAAGPPNVVLADGSLRAVLLVDLASDPTDDPAAAAVAGLLKIDVVARGAAFARLYVELQPGDEEPVLLLSSDGSGAEVVRYAVVGKPFILDGSRSLDDEVVRTFSWTQVSGPFRFTTEDAELDALANLPGGYVFDLTVSDNIGLGSFGQRLHVPVLPAGLPAAGPPSARAVFVSGTIADGNDETPEVAVAGTAVVLSGLSSVSRSSGLELAGGADLAFSWRQVRGPQAVLIGTDTPTLLVIPPVPAAYELELTVTDGHGVSDALVLHLTVAAAGQPAATPVLLAIPDQVLPPPGAPALLVTLDGTGSSGAGTLTYRWTQTGGVPVFIENADSGLGSIRPPLAGLYAFELRVFDGLALSAPVVRSFRVRATGP